METKPNTSKAKVSDTPVDEKLGNEELANKTLSADDNSSVAVNNETTVNEITEITEITEKAVSDESNESETVVKTISNKELIAYLAEKFPQCFFIKGAAKPLKIGIFQELAKQLADDDKVSKTRLRQVLRHYTSSWRYLKAIKLGAQRIDLLGENVEEIDQAQADYASKTLKESQDKFAQKNPDKFANKKEQDKLAHKSNKASKAGDKHYKAKSSGDKISQNQKHKAKFDSVKSNKDVKKKAALKLEKIDKSALNIGQAVKVQLGNSPMDAIVKEVSGNDVSVELSSGMVVKTKLANLFTVATEKK
jgi:ProP effector